MMLPSGQSQPHQTRPSKSASSSIPSAGTNAARYCREASIAMRPASGSMVTSPLAERNCPGRGAVHSTIRVHSASADICTVRRTGRHWIRMPYTASSTRRS